MTNLRQAAQQALEALESGMAFDKNAAVLQNLRKALEQPEQGPVAFINPPGPITQYRIPTQRQWEDKPVWPFVVRHYIGERRPSIKGNGFDGLEVGADREEAEQFVAWVNAHIIASPKRPWVGLTNKEIAEILCDDRWQMRPELMLLACQAKLKEKNHDL